MNLTDRISRRKSISYIGLGLFALSTPFRRGRAQCHAQQPEGGACRLSLAQWSLHRMHFGGKLDTLNFPAFVKEHFAIGAVEYVNQFFKDKANNQTYLSELKRRCDDHGTRSLLIMCDQEGMLGALLKNDRIRAVENHYKWVEAAQFLGCHSIRVNVLGTTTNSAELASCVVESLFALAAFSRDYGIAVLVENHGGYSSNGKWLAEVIRRVNLPNCGTLPDTGNFCLVRDQPTAEAVQKGARLGACREVYDRYAGLEELLPYAKGLSAKTYDFDDQGDETSMDYRRIIRGLKAMDFDGHIGIEYDGYRWSETEGVLKTKQLLTEIWCNEG